MEDVFVSDLDWNDQFDTPDEFAELEGLSEGAEFALVRLSVSGKTTYRIVDGKPVPVAIAFAERNASEG
jgi:hypothetical protein